MRIILPHDAAANDAIVKWVMGKLQAPAVKPYRGIGLEDNRGRLVAGVVFNGYNGANVDISVYAPGHIGRRELRAVFGYAFGALQATRITARTRRKNVLHSAKILERLGFRYEGKAVAYYGEGRACDAMVYRMLRHECRWIGEGNGRTKGARSEGDGRRASADEPRDGYYSSRPEQHQPGHALG
jgi:RimJ/RimL family protein N-acetyltransferase